MKNTIMEEQESKHYFYVHGLGSSKNSKKFKEIKKHYPNAICLEWKVGDNLRLKMDVWIDLISSCYGEVTLIGSSTGCNLIHQMLLHFLDVNTYVNIIMLNPLFSYNQMYDKTIIPDSVAKYLLDVYALKNGLIILSDNDEIINHKKMNYFIRENNKIIISENDNHNLENLEKFFPIIDEYIDSIYI